MSRIVLASKSPRRRALLENLGLDIGVEVSGVDEHFQGSPADMVISNAEAKCNDVRGRIEDDAIIIAADTLVFLGDEPLGKPADLDEACAMIRRLSGATHTVITGVAVWNGATSQSAAGAEHTDVTFRELSGEEIDTFVHAVKPTDRAGAYTVDGPGSLLVAKYEGCYQNVLGLPLVRLDKLLRETGFNLFDRIDPARATFL